MILRGKSETRERFTTTDRRTIRDGRLSYRALGVLLRLLDLPDGASVSSEKLAEANGREGRDAVRTALTELEDHGYLRREKVQHEDGRWTTTCTVQERPLTEPRGDFQEPTTDYQASVNQATVSQALIEKKLTSETISDGKKQQRVSRKKVEPDNPLAETRFAHEAMMDEHRASILAADAPTGLTRAQQLEHLRSLRQERTKQQAEAG